MKHIKSSPKQVCAIHDLSALGRCALTVVIPALSALGVQTIPLPTALLSTHTGGYSDIYIRDLSPDMKGMAAHWRSLGVKFDAIYTGFVLDASQGHIISDVIDSFSDSSPLILVDPVMGDDGVLYSTCTEELREVMAGLCRRAHVITPNLTEACILTHTPYPERKFASADEARNFSRPLLEKLSLLCPKVAITGIEYEEEAAHVMTALSDDGQIHFFDQEKVGSSYPGTGELFASLLLGMLLDGEDFCYCAEFAGQFVAQTISASDSVISETRLGTALEPALMKLAHDRYERLMGCEE